jgi:colanic acid biosynthesis glycosyl transferase WcaI
MRIHLISNLFAPDELAGAALYTDLALYLRERGHDVRVTTTFAYYPAWKLRPDDVGVSVREETFEGIPVRRVAMYVPERPTGKTRLVSDLSFLVSLLRRGRFAGWQPDIVLTAIPMLSQSLAQRFLYWGRTVPRLIVVQDFVVEAALELGILRLPGLAGLLRGIQRWALRSAQTLVTISPQMLTKLEGVVGPDRRTLFLPNWIHGSLQRLIDRQPRERLPRAPQRLFYAGNLGVKQGLPDFLETFRAARVAEAGWNLAIHGGGAERTRLAEAVTRIPGCNLGEVLEEDRYLDALLGCTACLVTQRPGVGANFLPSKLLPALATGTPVLAVCDRQSPLAEEVLAGGFGAVVSPDDSAALKQVLTEWQATPEKVAELGHKAAVRAHRYRRETILSQYEQELVRLGTKSGPASPAAS